MFRACSVIVLAALVLAGCSSGEATPPKTGAATPNLPCSLPYGTNVALVSPAPGSQARAGSPIVLVASHTLPKTVTLIAIDRKGRSTPVATLERLAVAPRVARPSFTDPVYYRAAGTDLGAHRHYTLALDDPAQNGCAPYVALTGEARFST
jgi:hypothetical protein